MIAIFDDGMEKEIPEFKIEEFNTHGANENKVARHVAKKKAKLQRCKCLACGAEPMLQATYMKSDGEKTAIG